MPTASLTIGSWQIDAAANEFRCDGQTVRVEPKVMLVLLRLAAKPGAVVTRDDLLRDVWPGVVVGDEALTQAVIKLRRALGDETRKPKYVETITKRGYRLIAPVTVGDATAAAEASVCAVWAPTQPQHADTTAHAGPRPWPRSSALLLLVLAVALLALAWGLRPSSSPPAEVPVEHSAEVTVAVVPFESLGAAADQSYLARGLSNDLITELSRVAGLRVVRAASGGDAGGGSRYIVTGNVQHEGDTLRVNVQLVDSRTRRQVWSERFERPFGDLFAVQDAVTSGIVKLLPGELQQAARESAARRYTRNLEAYDYFLRGQTQFLMRTAHDNDAARESYRRAIELDPAFARAYAGLAMTHALDPRLRSAADAAGALARALELAETARQIDPAIPEVHWALGFVQVQQKRHAQALVSLQQAVTLNRSYADAYALMAGIHTYVGEPEKTLPLVRTAQRFEPDGGYLYFLLLGRAYFFLGDIEQALINLRAAATRNPVDLETRLYLAATLMANEQREAAEWEVEEIRTLAPSFTLASWLHRYPLTSNGQRQRLRELLAGLRL